jgi:hypothetical protein
MRRTLLSKEYFMNNGETPLEQAETAESVSTWKKIKQAAPAVAFWGVTGWSGTVASTFYGVKIVQMQYQTAELNLAVAKKALEQ